MQNILYKELASCIEAYENSSSVFNIEWRDNWKARIEYITKNFMPSGSGFDSGTRFDFDESGPDKLVFNTAFHHMNDCGFYDGWTEHTVTVYPSLRDGFKLRISGRNRNDIKEYIHEEFYWALGVTIALLDNNEYTRILEAQIAL